MIVGQERVGKTSLMRNLTRQSFNRNESSTEGITSSLICNIDIQHATSWRLHQEGGESNDPTSFQQEYKQGVASEVDYNINQKVMEQLLAHEKLIRNASGDAGSEPLSSQGQAATHTEADKIKKKKLRRRQESGNMEEPIVLSIWDFAGQDLYYTTHQTFLSSRAIYVVVFNLCHDLNKPVPDCSSTAQGQAMTPIQYLDFWMRSVYTYTKENPSQVRLDQKSPPIFLVGTHRNSVGGEDMPDKERKVLINDIFTHIRKELCTKPYWRFVVNDFYAIENSLPSNSKKISHLRDHIEATARKEPYMGEEIPLRWLKFDRNKMTEVAIRSARGTETPVLNLNQIKKAFGVEDETELLTMLKFYHDLGHIIYFGGDGDKKSQALKDVVILDPQWLIDVFKKVITVTPPQRQMTDHVQSWNRLKEDGILEDILIRHMWQDILPKKQALLDLMGKFDLLCERVDQHNDPTSPTVSYYVPSMLQKRFSVSQESDKQDNASVFFVDFQGFLPDGLFHRLVVRALRWSQDLGGKDPNLQYERGSFYVDVQHEFALQLARQNNLAFIKVSVMRAQVVHTRPFKQQKTTGKKTPSPDITKKVHDFVEENLQNLKDMWIKRINYTLSVECPCQRGSLHLLPLDKCLENPEVSCRIEKSPQKVIPTNPFRAMFNQESSEEEPTAIEDKQPFRFIHLREIAKELGGEWERLATYLDFTPAEIFTFKADHPGSVGDAIFSMLTNWKQRFKGGDSEVVKMKKQMAEALGKIDKNELAGKVQKY
ncbi:uncharacterized protein LOC119731680 isoform X1 [Patiria miniata]|uniref:non-specific serine/threonine protein kinase n=1 Tax=Patiria miniata TaxID=46514 RepID=A0A914ABT7_PATMI|nr:uncharacterized protein LOC119731680 isoform X1 [Patiria miniata]